MKRYIGTQSRGMYFLILFYTFVLIQNVLGLRQFGGSAFLVAVICGTLVYMTIGLIRRQAASWFIAVMFHAAYQVMLTISIFALRDKRVLQELYKVFPAESVPTATTAMIAVFCLLTAANVYAVVYLFRNKKHFVSAVEPE
ncbi:MAG TPA: hypothetical protein PK562_08220 [Candidatus Omnitrophota bacterium]|nr:hypothetical protein [Candidatus Omnitrophota bacterium]